MESRVARELMIRYAMEKYYGVDRPVRYVRLSGTSSAEPQIVQTSHTRAPSTSASASLPGRFGLPLLCEDLSAGPYGLKGAAKELAAVKGSKEVFQILNRLASQDFRRGVNLIVPGAGSTGWN